MQTHFSRSNHTFELELVSVNGQTEGVEATLKLGLTSFNYDMDMNSDGVEMEFR